MESRSAQLTMAYSVCRGITRANAKNFYYGFLVLPKRKRNALCAVYAFMRRCDDIADDPSLSFEERRYKLDNLAGRTAPRSARRTQRRSHFVRADRCSAQYMIPAGLLDELAMGTAMDVVDPCRDQESFSLAELELARSPFNTNL